MVYIYFDVDHDTALRISETLNPYNITLSYYLGKKQYFTRVTTTKEFAIVSTVLAAYGVIARSTY